MPCNKKIFFCTFLFLLSTNQTLLAMENSNNNISAFLERLEIVTPSLTQDQKEKLNQLIEIANYSNIVVMSDDDFQRFMKNYKRVIERGEEDRQVYLDCLYIDIDEKDIASIEIKKTGLDRLQGFIETLLYIQNKLIPAITIPLFELFSLYNMKTDYEQGKDIHKQAFSLIEYNTLIYLGLYPRNSTHTHIALFGLITFQLRRLDYESLKFVGNAYCIVAKELFYMGYNMLPSFR